MSRRLLRSNAYSSQATGKRSRSQHLPLFILIIVSILIVGYNLSSWRELTQFGSTSSLSPVVYHNHRSIESQDRKQSHAHSTLHKLPSGNRHPPSPSTESSSSSLVPPPSSQAVQKPSKINFVPSNVNSEGEMEAEDKTQNDDVLTAVRDSSAPRLRNLPTLSTIPAITRVYEDPFQDGIRSTEGGKASGCQVRLSQQQEGHEGGGRPMSWIVPPSVREWPQHCQGKQSLCDVLRRVAIKRSVMVAVANSAAPGLQGFLDSIKALKIRNFMVVALDTILARKLEDQRVPYYYRENRAQGNHGVSAQKFGILKEFVSVGCSVLLTDTDVVYLQNPFQFLYGDSDIEGMSDGWDNGTVHGFLDPVDDPALGLENPARHGHTLRVAALNSGLWYVSATLPAFQLMSIMAHRLATEDLWDQAGYNLELFQPSRDDHYTSGCTMRVMDPLCFVNSKVMFRYMRHKRSLSKHFHWPVAVHANYHTDKHHKMDLVAKYYLHGNEHALQDCKGDGCSFDMESANELESLHLHSINDGFVGSRDWRLTKPKVLHNKCAKEEAWGGKLGNLQHDLHFIKPTSGDDASGDLCSHLPADSDDFSLCQALSKAAINQEVVMTVVSKGDTRALAVLASSLSGAGVHRPLFVVALDGEAEREAGVHGLMVWRLAPHLALQEDHLHCKEQAKWRVAAATLALGLHLLLIDPQTVIFRDPFDYLYRDSDVEVASDGWDDATAYGVDHVVDDPKMGWSRFVHGIRMMTRDPGLVYLRATHQSLNLAVRLAGRLMTAKPSGPGTCSGLEHSFFNEETWLPSHGPYTSVGVITRVMSYLCFANSKAVTRFIQNDVDLSKQHPVAVRLSYHKEPATCAEGILNFYMNKDKSAIQSSCPSSTVAPTRAECEDMRYSKGEGLLNRDTARLVTHVTSVKKWSWGGVIGFMFKPQGELVTPWGSGSWGLFKGKEDALWAEFVGSVHYLTFSAVGNTQFGMFISVRCGDGDVVIGRIGS